MPDIVDWLAEARKIASKVRRTNPGVGFDDAIGAAHVAVALLLNDFDSIRGTSPLVHVRSLGLERAIDELRAAGVMRRPEQPDRPEEQPTADLDKTNHTDPASALRFLQLASHPCLSPRESLVLRLRYGKNLTLKAISERIGRSESGVWNSHERAISKLRVALGGKP